VWKTFSPLVFLTHHASLEVFMELKQPETRGVVGKTFCFQEVLERLPSPGDSITFHFSSFSHSPFSVGNESLKRISAEDIETLITLPTRRKIFSCSRRGNWWKRISSSFVVLRYHREKLRNYNNNSCSFSAADCKCDYGESRIAERFYFYYR
jgi:hypothetical protein